MANYRDMGEYFSDLQIEEQEQIMQEELANEQRQYEEKFKPTHFIEQYVPNDYKFKYHSIDYPLTIAYLDENLKTTKKCGLKTIAIFKIQFKGA